MDNNADVLNAHGLNVKKLLLQEPRLFLIGLKEFEECMLGLGNLKQNLQLQASSFKR